jgi:hypothetical protein
MDPYQIFESPWSRICYIEAEFLLVLLLSWEFVTRGLLVHGRREVLVSEMRRSKLYQ